ncbi:hypothetical protein HMPREF9946_01307 [Acetobacteraceae bacterium AT-5844]|nr:hypothetical protein HMPREF9946_01307 [Acetobacteraceae bacterium AT-5844]
MQPPRQRTEGRDVAFRRLVLAGQRQFHLQLDRAYPRRQFRLMVPQDLADEGALRAVEKGEGLVVDMPRQAVILGLQDGVQHLLVPGGDGPALGGAQMAQGSVAGGLAPGLDHLPRVRMRQIGQEGAVIHVPGLLRAAMGEDESRAEAKRIQIGPQPEAEIIDPGIGIQVQVLALETQPQQLIQDVDAVMRGLPGAEAANDAVVADCSGYHAPGSRRD